MELFHLQQNGVSVDISLTSEGLTISSSQDLEVKVQIDDVIAVDDVHSSSVDHKDDSNDGNTLSCVLYFIIKRDNPRWWLQKIVLTDSGDGGLQYFISKLKPLFQKCIEKRPKKLLFLLNPIGGRRQAQKHFDNTVIPVLQVAGVSWELIVSKRPKYLIEVARTYRYEDFDGVVVSGGDGTFCEVVNVMIKREQDQAGIDNSSTTAKLKSLSTPVGVIPTGSGNAKAKQLYGCLDVLTAILHIVRGNTRLVSMAAVFSDDKLLGLYGVVFANSLFADFFTMGDLYLRFLRDFRYLVMPLWYFVQRKKTHPYEVTIYARETTCDEQGEKVDKLTVEQETLPGMTVFCALENYGLRLFLFDSLSTLTFIRFFFNVARRVPFCIPGITQYHGNAFKISVKKSQDKPLIEDTKPLKVLLDGEVYYSQTEDYYIRTMNDVVSMYSSRTEE